MNDELFKPSCDRSLSLSFSPHFRKKTSIVPSLIQVGVKHPSKRDGEGLFGWTKDYKTSPHALVLVLCHQTEALRKPCLQYNEGIHLLPKPSLHVCSYFLSRRLFPQHCEWQTHPPRLSSISSYLSLSLPVTVPFLSFKREGRHLFLGYLPIFMMGARLIIRSLSLAYFCFNSGKLASQLQCVVAVV